MTRIIDLSIPLDNEIPADPPFQPVEIDYTPAGLTAPGGVGSARKLTPG